MPDSRRHTTARWASVIPATTPVGEITAGRNGNSTTVYREIRHARAGALASTSDAESNVQAAANTKLAALALRTAAAIRSIGGIRPIEDALGGDRASSTGSKADKGRIPTHRTGNIDGSRACEHSAGHRVGQCQRQSRAIVGEVRVHHITTVQIDPRRSQIQ